jgi:hypothetical protein
MKKLFFIAALAAVSIMFYSCSKNEKDLPSDEQEEISQDVKTKVAALGFSTNEIRKYNNGYIVEGDIYLSEKDLNTSVSNTNLLVANTEQYRTTNKVTGLPRTLNVYISSAFPARYAEAIDTTIVRYNALGLRLKFQKTSDSTKADIAIKTMYEVASGGGITLGVSAGFPDASGNPAKSFSLNTNPQAFGSNPDVKYLASVMAHEIGHAIGFRHTDYMKRYYSCPWEGKGSKEPAGTNGAILIPGTPSTPDAGSWMLACSDGGDRPFNANDIISLTYLFK